VRDLSARDVKLPALKALQGLLWRQGYGDGALSCALFPDVPAALRAWHTAGLPLVIYSSGSVPAQQLLFQHTDTGDWRPRIAAYFDTVTAGPKTDAASYARIAAARELPAAEWLFLSDNPREVAAAKEAGMQSLAVVREGNAPLSEEDRTAHTVVESFDQVRIKGVQREA
jgi:enolase-phosphatase E1